MTNAPTVRIELYQAREVKAGGLEGTLQIFRGDELLEDQTVNLSHSDEYELAKEMIAEHSGLSDSDADGQLRALMIDTRRALEDRSANDNGYKPPEFMGRARQIVREMDEAGTFIQSIDGELQLYMNGVHPVPVDLNVKNDPTMYRVLRQKFGINPTERIASYLIAEMEYHAWRYGKRVQPRTFAHYDAETNTAYVDEQAGNVLRVTADGVDRIHNGEDGVLFVPPRPWRPWKYTPTKRDDWSFQSDVLENVAYVTDDESPLEAAEQQMLLLQVCVSIFLRSDMASRPIIAIVGGTDAGKSVLVRMIGKTLFGPDFDVNVLQGDKEDEFWNLLNSRVVVGWDNLDTAIKWLEDALATAATGANRASRKLYTDGVMIDRRADVVMFLTARTPRFRRPDVVTRLILTKLGKRSDLGLTGKAEQQIYESIARNRDRYMSEFVDRLRLALMTPRQTDFDSPMRIQDAYAVLRRLAISVDQLPHLDLALMKMRGLQHDFASEENPTLLTIDAWLDKSVGAIVSGVVLGDEGTDSVGASNATRWVGARDLFVELQAVAKGMGYRFYLRNEMALGRALSESKTAFEHRGIYFEKKRAGGSGTVYQIKREGEQTELPA